MKMLIALIIFTLFTFVHVLNVSAQQKPVVTYNSLHEMYKGLAAAKPQAYLEAHNTFRLKFNVPPLQWDLKLEEYAQNYASQCSAQNCLLKHSAGPYGENIFWELYDESTPAEIVKRFTDEEQNYDLQKGQCNCDKVTNKCTCGHFTAIIWKNTQRVGCAEVKCHGEKGKLVVCSYDPPGNVVGNHPIKGKGKGKHKRKRKGNVVSGNSVIDKPQTNPHGNVMGQDPVKDKPHVNPPGNAMGHVNPPSNGMGQEPVQDKPHINMPGNAMGQVNPPGIVMGQDPIKSTRM